MTTEENVTHKWLVDLSDADKRDIVSLLMISREDEGMLGFPLNTTREVIVDYVEGIANRVVSGSSYFLGVYVASDLVGISILNPNKMTNCSHIVEVTKGFVHPRYRGRNIVKLAFSAMVAKCESAKHDVLTLDVREDTRAHHLWVSFGFRQYGRLPAYSRINNAEYAGVFLFQTLSDLRTKLGE